MVTKVIATSQIPVRGVVHAAHDVIGHRAMGIGNCRNTGLITGKIGLKIILNRPDPSQS